MLGFISLVLGLQFLYFYFYRNRSWLGCSRSLERVGVRKLKRGRDKGGEMENEMRKIEGLVDFPMRNAQNCPT